MSRSVMSGVNIRTSPIKVLAGSEDVRPPRALHPVFYGSYDWHSCVHSYWMLARLRRRFLAAPTERGFERPYGWAWLLKLAEELAFDDDKGWSQNLAPLARIFAQRFCEFLPVATFRCAAAPISTQRSA
jgi:Protein of unknown function (DUF2891)